MAARAAAISSAYNARVALMETVYQTTETRKATTDVLEADYCCRICSGIEGRYFRANGFPWFACARCGTTQKILTSIQYRNLNPSYDPGSFLDSKDRHEIENYLSVDEAESTLRNVAEEFVSSHASPRRFLDIGCGMGQYLMAAQRLGFEVLGFEPSKTHARVGRELLKLPIVSDYFSADKISDQTFDLVMLSHVIEHIYDPQQFIRDIIQSLRIGGALIVITPNNDSIVARSLGTSWPMLKPVDHVSMISARAFTHFDLGSAIQVHHSTSEYPYEYMSSMLAAVKSKISGKSQVSSNQRQDGVSMPPPLRRFGFHTRLLRFGLTIVSVPMYVVATLTGRHACLKSIVVRTG
jgi:SAM-dependent methyltransferase